MSNCDDGADSLTKWNRWSFVPLSCVNHAEDLGGQTPPPQFDREVDCYVTILPTVCAIYEQFAIVGQYVEHNWAKGLKTF